VVKRKIQISRREPNPRTPIVQPVAQHYTTEVSPHCYGIYLIGSRERPTSVGPPPVTCNT